MTATPDDLRGNPADTGTIPLLGRHRQVASRLGPAGLGLFTAIGGYVHDATAI
jgi:hypothetical protein